MTPVGFRADPGSLRGFKPGARIGARALRGYGNPRFTYQRDQRGRIYIGRTAMGQRPDSNGGEKMEPINMEEKIKTRAVEVEARMKEIVNVIGVMEAKVRAAKEEFMRLQGEARMIQAMLPAVAVPAVEAPSPS